MKKATPWLERQVGQLLFGKAKPSECKALAITDKEIVVQGIVSIKALTIVDSSVELDISVYSSHTNATLFNFGPRILQKGDVLNLTGIEVLIKGQLE